MPLYILVATRRFSDYAPCLDLTETAVQDAISTESYGNFGLGAGQGTVPRGTTHCICWPVTCRDYVLQYKPSLSPADSWVPITDPPIAANGRYCVRLPYAQRENRYFRLVSSSP